MTAELRGVAREALEAARMEVVRRLHALQLPTSVDVKQTLVSDDAEFTGWRSRTEDVRRSSLTMINVRAVVSQLPNSYGLGLYEQLEPLSRALAAEASLSSYVPRGLGDTADPIRNALDAYAEPMALNYLMSLQDIAANDDRVLTRMLDELELLVERGALRQRGHLALDGIRASADLQSHGGVTLRGLTAVERGHWVEARGLPTARPVHPNVIIPNDLDHFLPRVVVDWVDDIEAHGGDSVKRGHRLALAFFLRGHDIAAPRGYAVFADPPWASFGVSTVPLPVEARATANPPVPIDQREFEAVVDLAHSIPPFGPEERTHEEVVLHRALRGCGAERRGLIDLATSLEAALLRGTTTELSYRFRLYGSLFLAPERDPRQTAEELKDIYEVRSRLVHGTPVSLARLRAAEATARTISIAVVRKAIETGWPARTTLDELALRA